jgi:hypothetical protein
MFFWPSKASQQTEAPESGAEESLKSAIDQGSVPEQNPKEGEADPKEAKPPTAVHSNTDRPGGETPPVENLPVPKPVLVMPVQPASSKARTAAAPKLQDSELAQAYDAEIFASPEKSRAAYFTRGCYATFRSRRKPRLVAPDLTSRAAQHGSPASCDTKASPDGAPEREPAHPPATQQ